MRSSCHSRASCASPTRSGEEYENAHIRLVVGKINLVEKIAQLARIAVPDVDKLDDSTRTMLRDEADAFGRGTQAARMGTEAMAEPGAEAPSRWGEFREKTIIKEGLSEYFIFSIDGTETIPNGWSKRTFDASRRRASSRFNTAIAPTNTGRPSSS